MTREGRLEDFVAFYVLVQWYLEPGLGDDSDVDLTFIAGFDEVTELI